MSDTTTIEKVTIDTLNKTFSDILMQPVKVVYMDLEYIQDLWFGAILLNSLTPEKYDDLLKGLDKYNQRLLLQHAIHFPHIGMTEEELTVYIKKYLANVCKVAPFTDVFLNLIEFHRACLNKNGVVTDPEKESEKIEYIINTYPFKLGFEEILLLKSRFQSIVGDVKLGITCQPLRHMSMKIIKTIDVFFVSDMTEMTTENTNIYNLFIKQFKLKDKCIFAPRRIGNPDLLEILNGLTQEEIDTKLLDTQVVFGFVSDFFYLDPKITVKPKTS